jgi:hypothetical protein
MYCREAAFTTTPPSAVAQEGMMESLSVGFSAATAEAAAGGEAFKREVGARDLGGEGGG